MLFFENSGSKLLDQGEILFWPGESGWRRFGVVVTADCDLARSKHWGVVTVAPVATASHAWGTVFIRRFFASKLELLRSCAYKQADLNPGISSDLASLLVDSSNDNLTVRKFLQALESGDPRLSLERMWLDCESFLPEQLSFKRYKVWLSEQLKNQLPGDLMLLPMPVLPGENTVGEDWSQKSGFGHAFGYAWLRFLREVPISLIADSVAMANSSECAVRTRRLVAEYRYKLTQQISAVFADIGIPNVYEIASRNFLEAELKNWEGGRK